MRKWLISFFLFFSSFSLSAQEIDYDLISEKEFINQKFARREISFVLPRSKNPVVRYNPLTLGFSSLLFFYQSVVSVQLSSGCSYHVSCSNFSKALIKEFGLLKGVALTADRLMRCNQIAAYDIVTSDLDFENQKVRDDLSNYHWHH